MFHAEGGGPWEKGTKLNFPRSQITITTAFPRRVPSGQPVEPLQIFKSSGCKRRGLQGRAKKILLSSVTHVPLGLMGCALAA